MGVQGGYAPLKIQFNLKTYSPSRACEDKYTSLVWAREGGERAPVALCREPTEPAGETGVGFTQGDPPAQGLAARKRAGALFTALRAGMTMLLPSLMAAAPLFKVVELRSTPRKLFVKSLTKNF